MFDDCRDLHYPIFCAFIYEDYHHLVWESFSASPIRWTDTGFEHRSFDLEQKIDTRLRKQETTTFGASNVTGYIVNTFGGFHKWGTPKKLDAT